MLRKLVALSVFASALCAQRAVSPENMHHRVWAVVPLVGAGTDDDPKRPMLVPTAAEAEADKIQGVRPDLLGYTVQLSDDGQYALVEFVLSSPLAFENLLRNAVAKIPAVSGSVQTLPSIASDGSEVSALPGNVATLKTALETAVPGLKLFERGKATPAQILAEFRTRKANFTFDLLGRSR